MKKIAGKRTKLKCWREKKHAQRNRNPTEPSLNSVGFLYAWEKKLLSPGTISLMPTGIAQRHIGRSKKPLINAGVEAHLRDLPLMQGQGKRLGHAKMNLGRNPNAVDKLVIAEIRAQRDAARQLFAHGIFEVRQPSGLLVEIRHIFIQRIMAGIQAKCDTNAVVNSAAVLDFIDKFRKSPFVEKFIRQLKKIIDRRNGETGAAHIFRIDPSIQQGPRLQIAVAPNVMALFSIHLDAAP